MAGLYLHIPFCRSKCSYCDFYSLEASEATVRGYTDLLLRHLDWASRTNPIQQIETVYFGGGTPSLLSPGEISLILKTIDQRYKLAADAEISLEANPGTVSLDSLSGYRSAGVNRISFGLQSSHNGHLAQLGRPHTHKENMEAVQLSRKAGFSNLSLDLMFALPNQSLTELGEELHTFIELGAEHFSCYGLTSEPDTPLQQKIARGELSLPEEGFYAEAFLLTRERLTAAGYTHYEIANYALAGQTCRHNLNYWQRGPYLGIGAGAHSFFADQWGSRWQVPADLARYARALQNETEPMIKLESFTHDSAMRETVYLALRTAQGISDESLQKAFSCTMEEPFSEALSQSSPWLKGENGHWSFSPEGWLLFDRLILPFL